MLNPPSNLHPNHLLDLRKSGLSDDTIAACGFYSESNYERLANLVNWTRWRKRMGSALVIPFRGADGSNGYCRLKPDNPRVDRNKKPVKYESPKGHPNQVFIPPDTFKVLDDATAELVITEGEKKAAKADQDGFRCIGLVGVFGWKDGKGERLLPELERIKWQGRQVRIAFDSDVSHKPEVRDAESRLAAQLSNRGAVVRVVRLPDGPRGADGTPGKVGLDDYLVAEGPGEFRKLLDAAEESDPVSTESIKTPASALDPYPEARAFLSKCFMHDGEFTLRRWNDEWYAWNVYRYLKTADAEINAALVRYLEPGVCKLNRNVIANIITCLVAETIVPGRRELPFWVSGPAPWPAHEVLSTRDSLIHLPSLIGRQACSLPPNPNFFSTCALNFEFDVNARCEKWVNFLAELWPTDQETITTLQDWFGYCLLPDTRQQKILLLVGPPRSGKGTIGCVMRELVGPDNVAGPTLSSLGTNFGLWPLLGKTVAMISDARLSRRSDEAQVVERLLTISGEDAVTVDRKNLTPITTRLLTRLVIITNELPRFSDPSGALASRFIILRMTKSWLGREEKALRSALLKELPGILLWAIGGWERLENRGRFEIPKSSRDLMDVLEDLSSAEGAFARDYCLIHPNRSTRIEDLFAAWCQWCRENARRETGTVQVFGRNLHAAFPSLRVSQQRSAGGRHRLYEGIGLTADGNAAAQAWNDVLARDGTRSYQ